TSTEQCDTEQLDEDCDGVANEPEVCNQPPRVRITLPTSDLGQVDDTAYDGRDEALGLWYVDLEVEAEAIDPNDGELLGSSLRWYTDRDDIHGNAFLTTGEKTTVRLYSN